MQQGLFPGEILAITAQAADRLLKLDSGDAALLYLHLLRHRSADQLKWTPARLQSALGQLQDQDMAPAELPAPAESPVQEAPPPEYTTEDITQALADGASTFPVLVGEVERRLGKRLSVSDLKSLYTLYDHLALPAEVILMLVGWCGEETERKYGSGRRPFLSQIKREGFAWARRGVDTMERAEEHIAKLTRLRSRETAVLRLTCPGGLPRHGRDWSLSRWTGEGWRRLDPEGERRGSGLALTLPAGRYRLMTTVRLPGGDQLAARRELELSPGKQKRTVLRLRPCSVEDLLIHQELPAIPAKTLDGTEVPDLFRMGTGPVLALWLEEGGEPTEHVLNELMEHQGPLPAGLLFLVRSRDSLSQPTLERALAALDGARVLLDDWAYDLEAAARCLGRDPDLPPLMVLCDGAGEAVYSDSGYRVGAVELALRLAGGMRPAD